MDDAQLAAWLEERWMAKSDKLQELQQLLEEGKDWPDHTDRLLNGSKELRFKEPSRLHLD